MCVRVCVWGYVCVCVCVCVCVGVCGGGGGGGGYVCVGGYVHMYVYGCVNPIPYRADYFGHKLHIDQNEKMVMFGVTHICGIDGYSGKIVGFVSMPIKNCIEIYSHFFM